MPSRGARSRKTAYVAVLTVMPATQGQDLQVSSMTMNDRTGSRRHVAQQTECSSAANDDTRPNAYSGTKESSVMKDDNERVGASSGTRQSSRSTNNDQRRQRRRRKSSSSSTDGDVPAEDRDHQEDGEVRAEDNGRRERRKKSSLNEARSSSTSTETALPKSTNTHAGASACTADQYAEDKKSTCTMMAPALDLQEVALPIIMQKEGFLPGS